MRPRPVVGGRHADRFVPLDGPSRAVHYWRHFTGDCPRHMPGRHRGDLGPIFDAALDRAGFPGARLL
jgi:hypothetical protein